MSGENVEDVRAAIEALERGDVEEASRRIVCMWNERDFEALRALVPPDFEYHGLSAWPDRPPVRDFEEWCREIAGLDSEFEEFQMELLESIAAGERIVAVVEITGIGKQSGAPVRFTEAFVNTISDGRIARIEACGTRERALEVAGIEE